MPWMYRLVVILIVAAVISLVLSFLVLLLRGALHLLPIVFVALVLLVVLGKVKIDISRGDRDRR